MSSTMTPLDIWIISCLLTVILNIFIVLLELKLSSKNIHMHRLTSSKSPMLDLSGNTLPMRILSSQSTLSSANTIQLESLPQVLIKCNNETLLTQLYVTKEDHRGSERKQKITSSNLQLQSISRSFLLPSIFSCFALIYWIYFLYMAT